MYSSAVTKGGRQRHQNPGGDSPNVLSLAGPIPGSGAFACLVLFWEVLVQKNIKPKLEDIIDFVRTERPPGRGMHNSDDRNNCVLALSRFVKSETSQYLNIFRSKIDFFECLAQGSRGHIGIGLLWTAARETNVPRLIGKPGRTFGKEDCRFTSI